MEGYGVVAVDADAFGKVYVAADVLGKGNAAEGVLPLRILLAVDGAGQRLQYVARGLYAETEGVGILSVSVGDG